MRNLNPAAFLRASWFMASKGAFCSLHCYGPLIEATRAAAWNGKDERILRVPLAHPKDRKRHGLPHAKTGVFGLAPLPQPRVKRGGEQADFWQVQQPAWPRAQLHAGSDRDGRTRSGDRDGG